MIDHYFDRVSRPVSFCFFNFKLSASVQVFEPFKARMKVKIVRTRQFKPYSFGSLHYRNDSAKVSIRLVTERHDAMNAVFVTYLSLQIAGVRKQHPFSMFAVGRIWRPELKQVSRERRRELVVRLLDGGVHGLVCLGTLASASGKRSPLAVIGDVFDGRKTFVGVSANLPGVVYGLLVAASGLLDGGHVNLHRKIL